ncbi:MAG: hypothetical protein ABI765_01565 [Gemmatimonadota bacterium]
MFAAIAAAVLAVTTPSPVMPVDASGLFGGPWVSIESPPNPMNAETRGALLVVRVYHHGDPAFYPVNGTAEGVVDGKRQSVALEFGGTSTPGMYALKFKKPADGNWVLLITVGKSRRDEGSVTAIVTLDRDGQVSSARVPTRSDGQFSFPAPVLDAEVASVLKQMGIERNSSIRRSVHRFNSRIQTS